MTECIAMESSMPSRQHDSSSACRRNMHKLCATALLAILLVVFCWGVGAATRPTSTCHGDMCDVLDAETHFLQVDFWAKDIVAPVSAAYMLVFVVGNFLHVSHLTFLPESLATVFVGMVLGWGMHWGMGAEFASEKLEGFINSMILNLFLLPSIIFESGWSLRRRDFISQLAYIVIFAVGGTTISMVAVGSLILYFGDQYQITHPRTALCFASLISAVDPVATLATFAHLNVDPLLNILVFGESVINDAVAIVLFDVLNDDKVMGKPGSPFPDTMRLAASITKGVCILMFGSMALAAALCFVYVLVLRFGKMWYSPAFQILFIFVSCFFSYSVAQSVGLSGIVTVLFNSVFMSTYARPHLSSEGALLASFLLKQMATLADTAVFLFVGVSVVFVNDFGLTFAVYLMPFCLIGRAAAIFPLGLLVNFIKGLVARRLPAEQKLVLTPRHMVMMWHAGLRGGIALSLVLDLGDWVDALDGQGTKSLLRNATFLLIGVFLLVFGGSTEAMLNWLGLPMGDSVDKDALFYEEGDKTSLTYAFFSRINRKFIMSLLVGSERMVQQSDGVPSIAATVVEEPVRRSDAVRSPGVMAVVMQQAEQIENEIAAVEAGANWNGSVYSRRSKQYDAAERTELHGLFGTDDPARMETMEAMRRATVMPTETFDEDALSVTSDSSSSSRRSSIYEQDYPSRPQANGCSYVRVCCS
eukprot:TRINITY_DN18390_c0_g1_i1.p1 TRINITY_DN18390_c0_g1~~TRINITY_DN18390_c0_g1_i1.p1  ORF type:complete len:701 (-),score=118.49 TRINITY_DN18390_c0_g1_i1:171-2273(-)